MEAQVDTVQIGTFDDVRGPRQISIPIPEDFRTMDVSSRIHHIAEALRSLESQYPADNGDMIRRTTLVKVENGNLVYEIDYIPLVDSEYE